MGRWCFARYGKGTHPLSRRAFRAPPRGICGRLPVRGGSIFLHLRPVLLASTLLSRAATRLSNGCLRRVQGEGVGGLEAHSAEELAGPLAIAFEALEAPCLRH